MQQMHWVHCPEVKLDVRQPKTKTKTNIIFMPNEILISLSFNSSTSMANCRPDKVLLRTTKDENKNHQNNTYLPINPNYILPSGK